MDKVAVLEFDRVENQDAEVREVSKERQTGVRGLAASDIDLENLA
jgi:hypothetical protein